MSSNRDNKALLKSIVVNTVTNYVVLFWRMISAVFITRLLYLGLGQQHYGFWSLLWMIFGYSLLLDFGFGTSIQKFTAEADVSDDWTHFNQLLSTIIGSYLVMSCLIILSTLIATPFLQFFLTFENPENIDYYKKVFLTFGVGTAVVFPTGAFTEILKGMKRLDIRNYILLISTTINLIGIYYIFQQNYSLYTLTLFSLALTLITNLTMLIFAYLLIPSMKISIKLFRLKLVGEVVSFSFFAYLVMFANMIIYKTDQIILGVMLGMGPVAIYQIGSRVSFLMTSLTSQFQDNLAPIVASLYKAKDHLMLRQVIINSNRFVAFIATYVFILLFILVEPILFVWLKELDKTAAMVAYILLISVYIIVLFRSVSSKFLLMTERHRILSVIAATESISNLIISIVLIHFYGIIGVALGTLIPSTIISVGIIFPLACRHGNTPYYLYIKKVLVPIILVALPSTGLLLAARYYYQPANWTFLGLIGISVASGLLYTVLAYIFYFDRTEKEKVKEMLPFPV